MSSQHAVDPNMDLALAFAKGLAHSVSLPASLGDVERRAELVAEIDGPFVLEKDRWLTMEEIGRRISAIDKASSAYMPDVSDALSRLSIALRLWAACILAAKTIADQTLSGLNNARHRQDVFSRLDAQAEEDPVFTAGLESAPAFKRRRNQPYSFDGVPVTSPVRRYP